MTEQRYLALFQKELEADIAEIQALVAGLMTGDQGAAGAHNDICRIIHSVAGTAGSVELADLADLTAALEDALRRHGPGYTPDLAQLILDIGAYGLERLTTLCAPRDQPADAVAPPTNSAVDAVAPTPEQQERYAQLVERLALLMEKLDNGQVRADPAPTPSYGQHQLSAEDLAILRAFDEREPDATTHPWATETQAAELLDSGPFPDEVEYFMLEASETLGAMHEALTQLGHGGDDAEAALAIQRLAHKLKGAASTIGYTVVGSMAHRLEDLMALVRRRTLRFTPATIEATLHGLTAIETSLHHILNENQEEPRLLEELSAEYEALAATATAEPSNARTPAPIAPTPPPSESTWQPPFSTGTEHYLRVDVRRLDQLMGRLAELAANRTGLDRAGKDMQAALLELRQALQRLQAFYNRLAGHEPETYMPLPFASSAPQAAYGPTTLLRASNASPWSMVPRPRAWRFGPDRAPTANGSSESPMTPTSQLVARVLAAHDRAQRARQTQDAVRAHETTKTRPYTPPSAPAPGIFPATERLAKTTTEERWDPLELDQYTDFDHLVRSFAEIVADLTTISGTLREAIEHEQHLLQMQGYLTSQVQHELMELRLVPISQIIPRLQRAAHIYATELGKTIQFVVQGESTQVDREVVEAIVDPLIQLVRNSIAHGIEAATNRVEQGKPETGLLWLRAYYVGNEVVLEFGDDGQGINPHLLAASAVAAGQISPEEIQGLAPDELLELIFAPGVSTSEEVTALAGRGIGMDLVRSAISALKGSIRVQSESGRGTVFHLRVPISLSILQVLQVQAAGISYAAPLLSVEEIRPTTSADITVDRTPLERPRDEVTTSRPALAVPPGEAGMATAGNTQEAAEMHSGALRIPRYHLRLAESDTTTTVPAFRLAELLGMATGDQQSMNEGASALILQVNRRRVAVLVDRVTGEREVVVKRLPPYLRRPGVHGASLVSAGEVLLVLDIPDLAAAALRGVSALGAACFHAQPPQPRPGPAVLVADDSPSIRRSLKQTLTRAGYQVVLARDGMEALEQMVRQLPRALLLDIEMPRLDGFELLSIMRNHQQFMDVPVIVLTSRGAAKHRQHMLDLGANGYLVKPCPQDELLAAVAAQIAPTN